MKWTSCTEVCRRAANILMPRLFAGTAVLLLTAGIAPAAPYIPSDGKQVLERLPSRNDPAQAEFKRKRAALSKHPNNLALATDVARQYIQRSRNEGDPRYLGYAQAALRPWWSMARPPVAVLVLRATLLQSTHRFDLALLDLDRVLQQDPDNGQAWITRATILQVQGRYAEAMQSCRQLSRLASHLITLACAANVASLHGQAEDSYAQLRDALRDSGDTDAGIQVWILTLLAEMAQRKGDTAAAEMHFSKAIGLGQPDTYLLGAYADFLLDQQRYGEVVELLNNQTRVDALLLRYALALQAQSPATAAASIEQLQQRFEAARLRGDSIHDREQARFELHLLNNAQAALKTAQANWQVQKEPADVRILLEAALAADNRAAAQPVLAWLKASGMQYAALLPLVAALAPRKTP